MMFNSFRYMVALAVLVMASSCGSSAAGGGQGDLAGGGDKPDTATFDANACTTQSDHCNGTTLFYCEQNLVMLSRACTVDACKLAGFKGIATPGCGIGADGTTGCLCLACTIADTKCVAETAYACDVATGKIAEVVCDPGLGLVCKNGKCVQASVGPVCGNGSCESGETATSCAKDCPHWCDSHCGPTSGGACACDNLCASYGDCCLPDGTGAPKKDNKTCAGSTCADCNGTQPMCGDGKCNGSETSTSCSGDCKAPATVCGNGVCEAGETTVKCVQDCPPPASCGDGKCQTGETAVTCPSDCKCTAKDTFCDPDGQSLHYCGTTQTLTQLGCSKACSDKGKTFTKCQVDPTDGAQKCFCKLCGNGTCEFGESYASCPTDCACTNGDNVCIDLTTADSCDGTKLTPQACSDSSCKASGLGTSLGCGPSNAGYTSCLCKEYGCPDGFCESNETKDSCPADCIACASNATCPATEPVCSASLGQCEELDGNKFVFKFIYGTVPGAMPDGSAWDLFGSPYADPYVELTIDGVVVCTTPYASDTMYPFWNAACTTAPVVFATSKVKIAIWDDDVGVDNLIDSQTWGDFATILKAGKYDGPIGTAKTSQINFTVTAQ